MRIIEFDQIGSTNDKARELQLLGESAPFWVRANNQTAGRGRRGRNWLSLSGNLFATLVLAFDDKSKLSPMYSFVAALAMAKVFDEFLPNHNIALKWPNDVYVNGQKISGILLESWFDKDQIFISIGIGVNLCASPKLDDRMTISLSEAMGDNNLLLSPSEFLVKLDASLSNYLKIVSENGFSPIIKEWETRAYGIGNDVKVDLGNEVKIGRFIGINNSGELILELRTGEQFVVQAGDVFFPH